MLNFLMNPIVLLAIAMPILLFLGILLGNYLSQPKSNRVIEIAPDSYRATEFQVKEQDAVNLRADSVGNTPPKRFLKNADPYNVVTKGWMKLKNYALYLARIGSAYTHNLDTPDIKTTLKKTMQNIFGITLYNQIPQEQKNKIEKGDIAVTIEFQKVALTPKDKDGEDMPSVSSDDLRRGDLDRFIGALARGLDNLTKGVAGEWTKVIFIMGSGIAVGIILTLVFGWGNPAS